MSSRNRTPRSIRPTDVASRLSIRHLFCHILTAALLLPRLCLPTLPPDEPHSSSPNVAGQLRNTGAVDLAGGAVSSGAFGLSEYCLTLDVNSIDLS